MVHPLRSSSIRHIRLLVFGCALVRMCVARGRARVDAAIMAERLRQDGHAFAVVRNVERNFWWSKTQGFLVNTMPRVPLIILIKAMHDAWVGQAVRGPVDAACFF